MSCPICIDNPANSGHSIMCSKCGNFICGKCVKLVSQNRVRSCPTCREPFYVNTESLAKNLKELQKRDHPPEADMYMGFICMEKLMFDKAREMFLRTEFVGSNHFLAILYRNEGDSENAKKYFLKSIKHPMSIIGLGEIHIENGNRKYGQILKRIGTEIVGTGNRFHYKTGRKFDI